MKPVLLLISLTALPASSTGQSEPAADPPGSPATIWEFLLEKYDENGDGKVSRKEYQRDKDTWKRLDLDGDGYIDQKEAETEKRGKIAWVKREAPEVGKRAPNFELALVRPGDGDADRAEQDVATTLSLSSFRGKRPVALVFGSYT